MLRRYSLIVLTGICSLSVGCKYLPAFDAVAPDSKQDYKKSQSLPDLEVPPDLSADAIKDTMAVPDVEDGKATYSTYQERMTNRRGSSATDAGATAGDNSEQSAASSTADASPAPAAGNMKKRSSALQVRGSVEETWPKLQAFWRSEGYSLAVDDEKKGRLETAWLENKTELARERFWVDATNQERGTALLTVGREAEVKRDEGRSEAWVPAAYDSERESRIMSRLEEAISGKPVSMVSEEERVAQRAARNEQPRTEAVGGAGLVEIMSAGEGKKYLLVGSDFGDTWRRTGAALEKAAIKVDDKDESRGVYYIRYASAQKTEGFLSRLAFWRGSDYERHQVSVTAVGGKSEVVVLDRKGNWEHDADADRILEALSTGFAAD